MRRGREIRASTRVPVPREDVFEFLANLDNHWLLADRFVEVLTLDRGPHGRGVGGQVRMRGPFGIRRTAATRVLAADPSHQMIGTAEIGRRTRAFVRWKLAATSGGSRVSLEATIDRVGFLDRLLLLLGGRRWLARRFASVLERLGERFPDPARPRRDVAAAAGRSRGWGAGLTAVRRQAAQRE